MKRVSIFLLLILSFFFLWLWGSAKNLPDGIELKFSHQLHVIEQEMECLECHEPAQRSLTGNDNLFPDHEICSDCHDVEDKENCNLCHQWTENPQKLPRIERYSQKFSHQQHLSAGLNCDHCHASVAQKTVSQTYLLPNMIDCMRCHQQKFISIDCATCHLPEENLMPISHTPNFLHNHSDLARNDIREVSTNKSCVTCHQPRFCQSCHEGDNLERLTHPLNFQFTHALEAQGKEKDCATCHTDRQFCINCHRENLVWPRTHKAGWVNQIPGDGGRHRLEAINDLEACMACHEQNAEQICQSCHGQ